MRSPIAPEHRERHVVTAYQTIAAELQSEPYPCRLLMPEHLSEDDLERLSKFAETPAYERTPEQLMPGESEEVD